MDKEVKLTEKPDKKSASKSSKIRITFKKKTLSIIGIIFIVLLILIIFVQREQIFVDHAATSVPPQGTNDCSPVPFYCLILGGQKTCTQPKVCPTNPPPPPFVAQTNQVASGSANPGSGGTNPASGSALPGSSPNPASGSANTCSKPPAMLTTKLIIHFDLNTATNNGYTIRSADMPALDQLAADLKNYPSATVTINGYTDSVPFTAGSTGPITNNQQLSVARAQAAENYLKSKGATANKYVISGKGATNFVAPNNPTTGNILNRRDEITTDVKANACTPVATKFTQPVCTNNVNWSGYLYHLPANTTKSSLSMNWTMSSVTCSGKLAGISQWPGVDAGNKDIAQLGTMSGCTNGKADYRAWVVHPPSLASITLPTSKYPAKPGDVFTATITMTSLGKFATTITNQTRKWSYSYPMTFTAADNKLAFQQELILENEGYGVNPNVPGLTQFTQTAITKGSYSENGGAAESIDKAPGLYCTNLNATGNIQEDNTSNMTNANYTIKWVHQ